MSIFQYSVYIRHVELYWSRRKGMKREMFWRQNIPPSFRQFLFCPCDKQASCFCCQKMLRLIFRIVRNRIMPIARRHHRIAPHHNRNRVACREWCVGRFGAGLLWLRGFIGEFGEYIFYGSLELFYSRHLTYSRPTIFRYPADCRVGPLRLRNFRATIWLCHEKNSVGQKTTILMFWDNENVGHQFGAMAIGLHQWNPLIR